MENTNAYIDVIEPNILSIVKKTPISLISIINDANLRKNGCSNKITCEIFL